MSENDAKIAMEGVKEEAEAYGSYKDKAERAKDKHTKDVLNDIADEEVVHLGEFAQVADKEDEKITEKMKEGFEEAEEMEKNNGESEHNKAMKSLYCRDRRSIGFDWLR